MPCTAMVKCRTAWQSKAKARRGVDLYCKGDGSNGNAPLRYCSDVHFIAKAMHRTERTGEGKALHRFEMQRHGAVPIRNVLQWNSGEVQRMAKARI